MISMPQNLKLMPMSLHTKYKTLMVNRQGNSSQAFMRTTGIIGEVDPSQSYQIVEENLVPTQQKPTRLHAEAIVPHHCTLTGEWSHPTKDQTDPSSVLGDIGPFIAQNKKLDIPVAATQPETLSYYGAQLLHSGDTLQFESQVPLPLFSMEIGPDYIKDYMLQKEHANGIFLEYHDRPHFHMPLDTHASGHLILGKKIKEGLYHVSAFAIPFKHAIYTPPGVIHNDSFLVGRYAVVYSQTTNFSTVRLLDTNAHILSTRVVGQKAA